MSTHLLIVTADGYGKRVPLADIPRRRRPAAGVKVSTAPVAAALVLDGTEQSIVVATAKGRTERVAVDGTFGLAPRSATGLALPAGGTRHPPARSTPLELTLKERGSTSTPTWPSREDRPGRIARSGGGNGHNGDCNHDRAKRSLRSSSAGSRSPGDVDRTRPRCLTASALR